ncbi:MAG: proprotein convertase P-domain-containing protein, partial [Gammaproteobacteria bacterium]
TAFEVDWARQQIVAVDADHRLHRIALADAGPGSAAVGATGARASTLRLTALEHVGVTRGFFVDEPGRAGALQLRLTVDHPRTSDLLVQLRAPSGAAADLPLPRRDGGLEDFIITGSPENALASLADESVTGQWELTVFDRLGGESGSLISWGLSFPGVPQFWDDSPVEGVPLPDPERTEQISVALASDGRKAATIPVRADARGAASVWDLAAGELIQDLPLTGRASFVRFLAEDRLLLAGPAGAALWHIGESDPIAEFGSATGFALPPAVSSDGRFFGVAEAIQDGVRIELYSHTAGRRLARFETDAFQDWALAQEAAAVVVTDASRRGRVIDPMTGETQTEFFHDQELRRILAAADHVVAVDVLGEVQVWSMTSGRRTLTPADAVSLGSAVSSAGVEVSRDGTLSGVVSANGTIRISRLSDGYRLAVFDQGPAAVIGTRIDSEGRRVVSADAGKIRSWQLPSAGASGHDFGDLSAVAIAPSGEFAVLGHRSGQVRLIRDLPAAVGLGPESTADYFGHRGVITSLAINQSGEMAGSGGSDGLVRVWDTQTGAPGRYIMRHPAGPINALAFSSNGRWIASAGPRSARVFDLETGSLVNEIEVEGAARALAFSPAGNVMAVGDAAGNLYILAPDGTQGVRAIRGRSPINVLRFTGTPEVLASGSDDGNLVFWNTLDGQAVQGALRFSAPIRWVDFSADESEAHVQSGSWLYQLTRNEAEFAVTAARLLPAYLRAEPALTQHEGPSIRALAVAGGGRLALADIPLTAAPPRTASGNEARAAEADTLTVIEARNWRRAMGLEIDPAGGSVRTILP